MKGKQTYKPPSLQKGSDGVIIDEDLLAAYFMTRRRALITELREIDRLLGRPQTITTERKR